MNKLYLIAATLGLFYPHFFTNLDFNTHNRPIITQYISLKLMGSKSFFFFFLQKLYVFLSSYLIKHFSLFFYSPPPRTAAL